MKGARDPVGMKPQGNTSIFSYSSLGGSNGVPHFENASPGFPSTFSRPSIATHVSPSIMSPWSGTTAPEYTQTGRLGSFTLHPCYTQVALEEQTSNRPPAFTRVDGAHTGAPANPKRYYVGPEPHTGGKSLPACSHWNHNNEQVCGHSPANPASLTFIPLGSELKSKSKTRNHRAKTSLVGPKGRRDERVCGHSPANPASLTFIPLGSELKSKSKARNHRAKTSLVGPKGRRGKEPKRLPKSSFPSSSSPISWPPSSTHTALHPSEVPCPYGDMHCKKTVCSLATVLAHPLRHWVVHVRDEFRAIANKTIKLCDGRIVNTHQKHRAAEQYLTHFCPACHKAWSRAEQVVRGAMNATTASSATFGVRTANVVQSDGGSSSLELTSSSPTRSDIVLRGDWI
ncbi:hypothetical protein BU17DRAFT_89841 [Hysterangium stoloniferum]|nr:hypothetical protein BU17DRAFT_89841 [Hysterangium stoloniferum]